MAAAARVAGCGERIVVPSLDGRGAAEVEVLTAPADELVTEALEAVELGGIAATLAVDVAVVDVDPRRGDRLLDGHPVVDDVDHDLHDRATESDRAGAADDEAGALVVENERGRHHARQAGSGPSTVPRRVQVVLAEHVVHVDACA